MKKGINYYLTALNPPDLLFFSPMAHLGEMCETLGIKFLQDKSPILQIDLTKVIKEDTKLLIGRACVGWQFEFCAHPFYGIYNLDNLKEFINTLPSYKIINDNGENFNLDQFLNLIAHRGAKVSNTTIYEDTRLKLVNELEEKYNTGIHYNNYEEYLEANHAQRGNNGLLAHKSYIDYKPEVSNLQVGEFNPPIIHSFINTNKLYDITNIKEFEETI